MTGPTYPYVYRHDVEARDNVELSFLADAARERLRLERSATVIARTAATVRHLLSEPLPGPSRNGR